MQSAVAVNCTDTTAIFDQSCWDALEIPNYLGNETGWIWNFPQCNIKTMAGSSGIGTSGRKSNDAPVADYPSQIAVLQTRPGRPAFCAMAGMDLEPTVP